MLMMEMKSDLELGDWMQSAFRGQVPEQITQLLEHRETVHNVFTEMMTQWPSSIREPLDQMHQLHKAETELMYATIESLFVRHLESH